MISDQKRCYFNVLAFLFLSSSTMLCAQQIYNSTANLSDSWINQPSMLVENSGTFSPIMIRLNGKTAFYCGFYCVLDGGDQANSPDSTDCIFCNQQRKRSCTFGVFITINRNHTYFDYYIQSPQLVWSPNRNNPVQVNATFQLSQDGDLILKNSDDTQVWSSQTSGKSVTGMNLTESGNLVLFDQNNETIWQSFDYPCDSLLPGQKLKRGKRLTASVSASNWSEGSFYLSVDSEQWSTYVNSDPPQRYFSPNNDSQYVELQHGSLIFQNNINVSPRRFRRNTISAAAFMKLGPDGHLKVFQPGENGWTEVGDLVQIDSGNCGYPLVCGNYGVCSEGGQCGCLETSDQANLFRLKNFRQPNLGCLLVTPISCDDSQFHWLLELTNTYYFAFHLDEQLMSVEECKNICRKNCSCKAAVYGKQTFRGRPTATINGSCLLLNEVFSIANNENGMASPYETTLYVKLQHPYGNVEGPNYVNVSRHKGKILAYAFAAFFGVFSVIGFLLVFIRKRYMKQNEIEEDFLDQVPGMPTRYSYENLKAISEDFSKKLGEGGFGSVYEGTLSNRTKVAVKCLDGLAQVRESFLVEVKAIGGIHHVNLVKLIGFCFEKSHRLLVYEYMPNKSLDRWIFNEKEPNHCLPWHVRKTIISDIAKGLAYLHEECSPKIIHLDIKPENILLDENFNAKISDFGLSKLIEKDQSRVITRMRGTPGYLAPEWLSAAITEKVDVYSFGIVMLEIICGRKNLDWSRTDEDRHLLAVFKGKAEEGKLKELVDKRSENMHENIEQAVEMMRIAAWCLQGDFTKRPSMSLVVKVLEGLIAAETNIEYDFSHPTIESRTESSDPWGERAFGDSTRLLPSALSGPR